MTVIAEKTTQFNAYLNGSIYLGVTTVELPSFEALSETIKGAGISGEVDSPTDGHFSSMSITLNWNTMDPAAFQLNEPEWHAIDLRSATQTSDKTSGKTGYRSTKITVKAKPKTLTLGTLDTGAVTDTSNEMVVSYIKVVVDGKVVLEHDKFNSVYIVNGKDYKAAERAALGN